MRSGHRLKERAGPRHGEDRLNLPSGKQHRKR
jgi:hypothetical protein